MTEKLRFWNGRPCGVLDSNECNNTHICVAAYSRADARRVCVEAGKKDPGDNEIKNYWSECWGDDMIGVPPERGLWVVRGDGNAPDRIKAGALATIGAVILQEAKMTEHWHKSGVRVAKHPRMPLSLAKSIIQMSEDLGVQV